MDIKTMTTQELKEMYLREHNSYMYYEATESAREYQDTSNTRFKHYRKLTAVKQELLNRGETT